MLLAATAWTIERLVAVVRETEGARDLLVSLAIVLLVLFARRFLLRTLVTGHLGTERDRLRWRVQVRRGAWVVLAVALLPLWASELRTVAFSLVALAAALVLATKELIQCAMGGVLKTSSNAFAVGDRIEIGGVRGDVVDHGWLATRVLEIGEGHQWTGRAVTIPNSALLSQPVVNETFTESYVLHVIDVPLLLEDDVARVEQLLLAAGQAACSEYLQAAKHEMNKTAREQGLPAPSVKPRVIVRIPAAGKLTLLLRLPVRVREKGLIEQRVLRRFLAGYREGSVAEP